MCRPCFCDTIPSVVLGQTCVQALVQIISCSDIDGMPFTASHASEKHIHPGIGPKRRTNLLNCQRIQPPAESAALSYQAACGSQLMMGCHVFRQFSLP